MEKLSTMEQLYFCTTRIETEDAQGCKYSGTGFFFNLTYDDKLRDGNIFYQFLYVKYLCEEKYDYKKLIENKENIQKEIIIYSEEDLKNKEELEEKLKKDDLEEFDNDEDDNSLPNISIINFILHSSFL